MEEGGGLLEREDADGGSVVADDEQLALAGLEQDRDRVPDRCRRGHGGNLGGPTSDRFQRDFADAALPCLRAYAIPATLFVVTGALDGAREFWWDDLERIVLVTESLPASLAVEVGGTPFTWRFDHDGDPRVLYHALQGAETCEQYQRDADQAGDEELAVFFDEVRNQQLRLAEQAKQHLRSQLAQARESGHAMARPVRPLGDTAKADERSLESFPASDPPAY